MDCTIKLNIPVFPRLLLVYDSCLFFLNIKFLPTTKLCRHYMLQLLLKYETNTYPASLQFKYETNSYPVSVQFKSIKKQFHYHIHLY